MNKLLFTILISFLLTIGCVTTKSIEPTKSVEENVIEIPKITEPILQDIEVINMETGEHDLKVKAGDKVRLKAIAHSYTLNGDDVGDKIYNFSPEWSSPNGSFSPSRGSEVLHIVPYNLGGVVTYWFEVKQVNSEGKIIKAKIRVDIQKE